MRSFPGLGLARKLMELSMVAVAEAVAALETEVGLVREWAHAQADALTGAQAAVVDANAARDNAVASLNAAQARIDDLAKQLADAAPGSSDADALLAEVVKVTADLAALHAPVVPPVDVPPAPPEPAPVDAPVP